MPFPGLEMGGSVPRDETQEWNSGRIPMIKEQKRKRDSSKRNVDEVIQEEERHKEKSSRSLSGRKIMSTIANGSGKSY